MSAESAMSRPKFTRQEVEAHNTARSAYVIIDNVVYDVSNFLEDHPGGHAVLLQNAGHDASKCFREVGHSELALELRATFAVGDIVDEEKWEVPTTPYEPPMPDEPVTLSTIINVWGAPLLMAGLAALLYIYLF